MTITAISIESTLLGVSQTSTSSTDTTTDTTDFLTLLMAELENQDPTDPMSTSELTAQMIGISQLEQSVKTNDYLETLSQYASSTNNTEALSCIGKTVTTDSVTAVVTGVLYSDGKTYLVTDSGKISLSDVTQVSST